MPLAMENCAKKVRVTPSIKNYILSLCNLTETINVSRISILRKRIGIIGRRPSDWSYLGIVQGIYQNLGISLISYFE